MPTPLEIAEEEARQLLGADAEHPNDKAGSWYTEGAATGARDVPPEVTSLAPRGTSVTTDLGPRKRQAPDYGGDVAANVGLGQGVTAGFSAKGGAALDTLASKLPTPIAAALEKVNASGGGHPGLSPLTTPLSFSERLAEYNQRNDDLHETHPFVTAGSQLGGGALLSAAAPGVTGATSAGAAAERALAGGMIAGAGYSRHDPTTLHGLVGTAVDSGVGGIVSSGIGAAGQAIGSGIAQAGERIDKRNIAAISEDTKKKFADKIYDNTDNVARTIRRDPDISKAIGQPKELLPILQGRLEHADAINDKIYARAFADSIKPPENPVAAAIVKKAEEAEARAAMLKSEMDSLPAQARGKVAADHATAVGEAAALRREAAAKITTHRRVHGVPNDQTVGALESLQAEMVANSRPQEAATLGKEIAAFKSGLAADPENPPSPMKVREFITRLQTRATTNDPQAETPLGKQALREAAGKLRGVLDNYVEEHAPGALPILQANNKKISAYRMIEDSALEQLRRDTEPAGPLRSIGNFVRTATTGHGGTGKLATAGAVAGGLYGLATGSGFAHGALEGGALAGAVGAGAHAVAPVVDKALASKLGQWTMFGVGRAASKAIPQPVIDMATKGDPTALKAHIGSALFGDDAP